MPTDLITSSNPHEPGQTVAAVAVASPGDVADAVREARAAQRIWARMGAGARAEALFAAAHAIDASRADLEELVVREVGKPRSEAAAEVSRAGAVTRYFAQAVLGAVGSVYGGMAPGTLAFTRRRPLGVAGLITPWNFPAAIPIWKAVPALAAGNGVILKPSPESAAVADALHAVVAEQLPPGLFAVTHGGVGTGEALVDAVDVVSFTGSTSAGRHVISRATGRGIPVQAEMGGHNVVIVLPDADLEATASTVVGAVTGYAGQKCTATRRIIVVGPPEPFLAALEEAMGQVVSGDPSRRDVTVGPVINDQSRARIEEAIDEATAGGAEVLRAPRAETSTGWYITPTLLLDPDPRNTVMTEEVFGPVASVVPVLDLDEALREANRVDLGLVAAVHGRDLPTLLRAVDGLEAGMIRINTATTGVDFHTPFGGDKASSHGPKELGPSAQDFFTKSQTVSAAAV
jgi:acyl-CoA reductase-like NAD-dependent aldehyde dehydrogenase